MSEEEIIDNLLMLKHFIELEKEENWQDYCNAIQGLLDLYQKGIKEIEELKEKNKHITKETVEFVNSHYISKDKIREIANKRNKNNEDYKKAYFEILELLEERN